VSLSNLTPDALLAATRTLIPQIAAASDEIERERRIPPALLTALTDAGLFRMTTPRSLGGAELPLAPFGEIIESIAKVDASTAWCLSQNAGIGRMAGYLPEEGAREIFGPPDARVAWGPGPCTVVRVKDGYRVTGRWSFASGMRHAKWLGANDSKVQDEDGRPLLNPDGSQVMTTLFFPASETEITDTWHVAGLRGTASDSYTVTDLFVPERRATRPEVREPGPLYTFKRNNVFAVGFASTALGLARASLDAFVDLAVTKTPRGFSGVLREEAMVQAQVAQAEATLRSARAFLREVVDDAWQASVDHRLGLEHRAMLRLAATFAIHKAKEVVDQSYYLAGATAIFVGNGFERRFRDMHAVTQQVQGRQDHYETVGQMFLGLEPSQQWF
jgi:alkylation response protein AidB-like acyl-CoA dehydrogenase